MLAEPDAVQGMRAVRATVALVFVLLAPSAALADAKKARVEWEQGSKLYDLGRFEDALSAFERAYLEKDDPVFLYNIGQCHRQASRQAEALRAYRSYLRLAPDALNRGEVERRIAELEQGAVRLEPNGSTASEPLLAAPGNRPAAAVRVPLYRRPLVWGVVAAVVVAGVVVGLVATRPSSPTCPSGVRCFQ